MAKKVTNIDIIDVKPIVLTLENGVTYTLEYTRSSVEFAERQGFYLALEKLDSIIPMSDITNLWHYAFHAHNKGLSKTITDKILFDDCGGITPQVLERLIALYAKPYLSLFTSEEALEKNSKVTIQL